MKSIFLLSILFISCGFSSYGQTKTAQPAGTDQNTYLGYTIRVIPADQGRFCYIILKENTTLIYQNANPFYPAVTGLSNREDVLKTAQWQIRQIASGTTPAVLSLKPLPVTVARELNVAIQ